MKTKKVLIIAEAGVNHNGRLAMAKRLIDAAAAAGADYIKFQTFNAADLVTAKALKADYQQRTTEGNHQLEMLKKLELSEKNHVILKKYAGQRKIKFLSTAFDDKSISLLKKLNIKTGKIPSGEITSLPYLIKMAQAFRKIIISTGMSNMLEIEKALKVLYANGVKKKNITVMHCTSEYPASFNKVNLLAMLTIKKKFDIAVGYSDHTTGIEVPVAAVALGATVIEKHLTISRNLKGPDHSASLEPDEFKKMVSMIRNIENALGEPIKQPTAIELKNAIAARKSIVAATDIKKNSKFTEKNITIKRPGNGISPMNWYHIIGKKAKKDFLTDEQIFL